VVFGSERLAFKLTCFRWHTEDVEQALNEARLYFQLQQKEQQQTEDGVSLPSVRSFMPQLHFAGFVDFSDVPHIHCRFLWQFVQVMSREGDSLAKDAVRQSASARSAHECLTCAALLSLRKLHQYGLLHGDPRSPNFVLAATESPEALPFRSSSSSSAGPAGDSSSAAATTSPPAAATALAAVAPAVRIIDLSHAGQYPFSADWAEGEIREAEGALLELRSADCLRHPDFGPCN
jgi:hypothetical protein